MSSNNSDNGATGAIDVTLPVAMTIAAFSAIAWYNVAEINIMIFLTFKKWSGLYFYSLLVASWGIFLCTLALMMKFFQVWTNNMVSMVFVTIGWYAMVTGQSMVLYSRLHLVVVHRKKIRWVLYMIIINVFLFHFPTSVVAFGSNSSSPELFAHAYAVIEKVQITAFAIQEFTIAGIYLRETTRILKTSETLRTRKRTRRVMLNLIIVNVAIILLDLVVMSVEYANLYQIQTTLKDAVYSVKLRLEFAVLNQLMSLTGDGGLTEKGSYSHSSSRGVTMDTFSSHAGVSDAREPMPKSYSVSVGTAKPSLFPAPIQENSVMTVTEIDVHTDRVHPDIEESINDISIGTARTIEYATENDKPRRSNKASSITSSEVDFAHAGF